MAKRINSKKLEQLPSFKKRTAAWLAKVELFTTDASEYNLQDMLAFGHRGFISHNEKDLSKAFDKRYEELTKSLPDLQKAVAENKWRFEQKLATTIQLLAEGDTIVSLIFEKEILS